MLCTDFLHGVVRRCAHDGGCVCFDGWGGANCDVSTIPNFPPLKLVSALWCERCNSPTACIVRGRCANNVMPMSNAVPFQGQGVLTLTFKNLPCGDVPAIFFSFGVADSTAQVVGSVGNATYVQLSPPKAFQPGRFLMLIPNLDPWPITYFNSDLAVSCLGRGCSAPVSQGAPFYARVTNMPVKSESDLEVTIGEISVSFSVISSNATETLLLITPPDCTSCKFSAL